MTNDSCRTKKILLHAWQPATHDTVLPYVLLQPNTRGVTVISHCAARQVVQTQDLQGHRWEVNNFSNTVWEAAIWMHHFFQVLLLCTEVVENHEQVLSSTTYILRSTSK